MTSITPILVHIPAYSQLEGALTYKSEMSLDPGILVRVPLGTRTMLGIVWDTLQSTTLPINSDPPQYQIKDVKEVLSGLSPLSNKWRELVTFSAQYYQRSLGEVALAALPPQLKNISSKQLVRKLIKITKPNKAIGKEFITDSRHVLTHEQSQALTKINTLNGPFLLFGSTGSGKTEVYLQAAQVALDKNPQAQILVMVPEINLTPQLEARFLARFSSVYGIDSVVSMHSEMSAGQRFKSWLSAHTGKARIVLGTRMAIFASIPQLAMIIVDEEHDPSYKQQEGARYSARDLAVYRGRLENAKVILGSATPSLESWHHSQEDNHLARYTRISMPSRIGEDAQLPIVRRVDMNHQPKNCLFSPPLLKAIQQRIDKGEQSLIFLNRRGYAPILCCTACEWKSNCPHCSAYRVFHKVDKTLRCHHCGLSQRVPKSCPICGNPDITTVGKGTEKLEEHLSELLSHIRRPDSKNSEYPDGEPIRIIRIDADSTKLKGELAQKLTHVHEGNIDILVGTQMITKGHDFRNITLVAAINPDASLFSSDFRAPERLFSLLMQAAGRGGRNAAIRSTSEMWVQTLYPQHPLFEALKKHDFSSFARQQLTEREQAAMPPFSFQAIVRAEAHSQEIAQKFLIAASLACEEAPSWKSILEKVTLFPAVPMAVARVANVERAQMLIESPSRAHLQHFLSDWKAILHQTKKQAPGKGLIKWAIDVDPLLI